jgi:hypothetical protein
MTGPREMSRNFLLKPLGAGRQTRSRQGGTPRETAPDHPAGRNPPHRLPGRTDCPGTDTDPAQAPDGLPRFGLSSCARPACHASPRGSALGLGLLIGFVNCAFRTHLYCSHPSSRLAPPDNAVCDFLFRSIFSWPWLVARALFAAWTGSKRGQQKRG